MTEPLSNHQKLSSRSTGYYEVHKRATMQCEAKEAL